MTFVAYLRGNPSAGLLVVQLAGLLLYPWMEGSTRGRALFGAFGLLVLGAALWVVRRSPWLTWLGVLLALPVVALSVANAVTPRPGLTVATAALEAVFYFYATGSLISYMLQDWVASSDELFAAGAPSRCWPGRSPMSSSSARPCCPGASVRWQTRRRRAPGWNCSP